MVLLFWRPLVVHGTVMLCNEFCRMNFSSPSTINKGQGSWLHCRTVSLPAPLGSQTAIFFAVLSRVAKCLLFFCSGQTLCRGHHSHSLLSLLMEGNKPSCGSLILLSGTYPMMKEARSCGSLIPGCEGWAQRFIIRGQCRDPTPIPFCHWEFEASHFCHQPTLKPHRRVHLSVGATYE